MIDPRAKIDQTAVLGQGVIIPASVTIEEAVCVASGVIFAAGDARQTIVGSGSQIGAGAVIGPGVQLGRGSVIRPGAVVFRTVPPNAIVEGNPAVIVGYTTGLQNVSTVTVSGLSAAGDSGEEPLPPRDLGVGGAALYRMKRVSDLRGNLTATEIDSELPFKPRRYFIVYDVPSSELRGEHAHRECHQFLVAVHGSCRILLDDGSKRVEVSLESPDIGVHMPPMLWGTQYRYTRDAVLLVFASHPYDAADYIRTYDEFLREVARTKI